MPQYKLEWFDEEMGGWYARVETIESKCFSGLTTHHRERAKRRADKLSGYTGDYIVTEMKDGKV
tara:strand:- start:82556 stop:82747 length:192 start_codon:yes stop_codon:yes gene_type:complete